jgi:hypothetical protein
VDDAAVRELIATSFILFRDFVRKELNDDPRELLGEEAWLSVTEISDVYEKERKECVDIIEKFQWTCEELQNAALETSCKKCGSCLLEPLNDSRRPDIHWRSC